MRNNGNVTKAVLTLDDGTEVTITGQIGGYWESVRTNRFGEPETGYHAVHIAWPAPAIIHHPTPKAEAKA